MTSQRELLLGKIRGLLTKTTANGCTEAEAMAALDKARAMMDAYEVTEADLRLTKEEAAIIKNATSPNDKHGIRRSLSYRVAAFCDCEVWLNSSNKTARRRRFDALVFCGLPSDVEFADWLLDHLHQFVQGELVNHLVGDVSTPKQRRMKINGFVQGCTQRINWRLRELMDRSKKIATSNSTALVVIKSHAVAEKLTSAGIKIRISRICGRQFDDGSYAAGHAAGDRASFGRPVGGGAARPSLPGGRR